jgi:hypothetical protein
VRHLGSIALSIVLAPLVYLLAGLGVEKFNTVSGGSQDWTATGIGALALIVAAGLYALLVMTRLSPLGPLVAGVLFLVTAAWVLFGDSSFTKLLGGRVLDVRPGIAPAESGLVLLLAVPLLATIVSPRRWRTSATPVAKTATGYPNAYGGTAYGAPANAAPAYGTPAAPYGATQPAYGSPQQVATPATDPYASEPVSPVPGQPTYQATPSTWPPQHGYETPQPTYATPGYGTAQPESPATTDEPATHEPVSREPVTNVHTPADFGSTTPDPDAPHQY